MFARGGGRRLNGFLPAQSVYADFYSITLDTRFEEFIRSQVESGRFRSASEVIRAGLRALENEQTRLDALQSLIDEGDRSGLATYSVGDIMTELDREGGK